MNSIFRYQKEAHRIQHLLKTKPFSANEIFIKNVEFVLANGGKLPELRPASMDLSLIQQHNIDVYAVAILVVLTLFFIVILLSVNILKLFTTSSRRRETSKKNN